MCIRTLQELDKAKRKKYAVTSLGNAELWKYTLSSFTKEFHFIFLPSTLPLPSDCCQYTHLISSKGNYSSSSIFQKINFHCRSIDYSEPPLPSLLFLPFSSFSFHLISSHLFSYYLFSSFHSYHFSLPPLLSNPSLRGIVPLQSYSPQLFPFYSSLLLYVSLSLTLLF